MTGLVCMSGELDLRDSCSYCIYSAPSLFIQDWL